ncbi:MAG: ABC transporter permease, partial [Sphaerochaeta sp.]|nr:ABC transporter permease [Sphaerochaeta sp.]
MKYLRGFLVVLIGWYLLAFLLQGPIIPYPHAVFLHLVSSMQTSKPYLHLLFSLYRIVMGMAFALLLAIPVGMLAGRTQKLDQLISPVLYLLYPLPKIAF